MAAFCLAPEFADAFKKALADGTIDPAKLIGMSSLERRTFFEPIVGKENALDVNTLFESKLLLKDQQRGLVTWAKKVAGISEPARRDLLSKIQRMDKVLQPDTETSFLSDLAQQKLGVGVTAEEAREIYELSQRAQQKLDAWKANGQMYDDVATRRAYGRALMDITEKVEQLKPGQGFWSWNTLWNVASIPKSMLTSIGHFSAPFVQGWGMLSTARAWQGIGEMFRYFAAEDNYKNMLADIITHPDYHLATDGKLGLTKLGDKLSQREEAIQSTLVEQANYYLSQATGLPNLVRASSRAFTGYLNYVRFNRFTELVAAARARGEDLSPGSSVVRDLANVVNDFTGRGNLGKGDRYAQVAPALNAVFFAPRKIAATVSMFNPARYLDPRISKTARIAAIRQLGGSIVATGAVVGLARAMGANVNLDPRSNDFLKIEIGDEKFDVTGGNAVYLRLLARLALGQKMNAAGDLQDLSGQKPFAPTRADMVVTYFRNKLSPVAGAMADALYGKDPAGRPFALSNELSDKLVPITIGDFIHFAMYDPTNYAAMLPSLAVILGVGMESPMAPREMAGMNVWGEPTDAYSPPLNSPVDVELKQLGYNMNFPQPTIQGIALTDEQYHMFIETAGQKARENIENDMSQPGWADFPKAHKLSLIKSDVAAARRDAADQVQQDDLAVHPGGDSLMDKANALYDQQHGTAP